MKGTELLEESLKVLGKQYPIQALTGWEHVKECKRFLAKYLAYSRNRFGQEVDHYKGQYCCFTASAACLDSCDGKSIRMSRVYFESCACSA